jgi:hypothetical protein
MGARLKIGSSPKGLTQCCGRGDLDGENRHGRAGHHPGTLLKQRQAFR